MQPTVTVDDVRDAAGRLEAVVHRTPVARSRTLDRLLDAQVWVKCEGLQRTGSFKLRGAYNAISRLRPERLERGICAPSSGNHAQAVARAASMLRAPAVIVMPADAPQTKRAAVEADGAEVVEYDRYAEDRAAIATALAESRGLSMISPFDDPAVIAGQGTVALELLEQADQLDAIVVPVSGGGLAAGCATAIASLSPETRLIGVEPEAGDDTRRSLEAGRRVEVDVPRTIADGLAVQAPGELTLPINARLLERVVCVSDDEIVTAMRFAFERMKLVLEPSGATALAALLARRVDAAGLRVGVVASGANVGAERFAELIRGAG